eukprot:1545051-Lingulodinium_polyedra.AAC.1
MIAHPCQQRPQRSDLGEKGGRAEALLLLVALPGPRGTSARLCAAQGPTSTWTSALLSAQLPGGCS